MNCHKRTSPLPGTITKRGKSSQSGHFNLSSSILYLLSPILDYFGPSALFASLQLTVPSAFLCGSLCSFVASAQVVPPHATVAGKTIGEWTAVYDQWAFLQPTNQNPQLDTDGSRANNGQSGPVFYVAGGAYTGKQPPRSYTVPEGKFLLIPILTVEWDNIDVGPPLLSISELRDAA